MPRYPSFREQLQPEVISHSQTLLQVRTFRRNLRQESVKIPWLQVTRVYDRQVFVSIPIDTERVHVLSDNLQAPIHLVFPLI